MATRIYSVCGIVIFCLCRATNGEDPGAIRAEPAGTSVTQRSADRIEQALREATDCDFADCPLDELSRDLENRHHIQFWIDKQALNDEGVNVDLQIAFKAKGIALESALNRILHPLGLTYLNRDGVLWITTQTKADEMMSTRVYPVADLVVGGTMPVDYILLMRLFQQSVHGKWADVDGDGGTMSPLPVAKSIVVMNTQSVHREISGLLAAVRKAKQLQSIDSIPANLDDPKVLMISDPMLKAVHQQTRISDISTWQRPRIHRAD